MFNKIVPRSFQDFLKISVHRAVQAGQLVSSVLLIPVGWFWVVCRVARQSIGCPVKFKFQINDK